MKKAVLLISLIIVVAIVFVFNTMQVNSISVAGEEIITTKLNNPHSIAFDSKGNMYVADSVRLNKIDSTTGEIIEFAKFSSRCMTAIIDNNDIIYACTSNQVYRIDQSGNKELIADLFTRADGFELDKDGNLYVADSYKNIIYKITPSGEKSIFIDSDIEKVNLSTFYVTGLLFSKDYKKLYTVRHAQGKIMVYDINEDGTCGRGEVLCSLGLGSGPDFITMDKENNLYVTSYYKNCVYKISPQKEVTKLKVKGARLKAPTGIDFGVEPKNPNSLYVANYEGGNIVEINLNEGN